MSEFNLTGTQLSEQSGVSKNTISAFRKGSQSLTVQNLEKLLGAMPEEARRYFFAELVDNRQISSTENLSQVA
jgi:transcriptional regulator with XRE-family HTH domain